MGRKLLLLGLLLIATFIFGCVIPQGKSEPKMCNVTETHQTEWSVIWKTYTNDQFGPRIGDATFPATFDYKWGSGSKLVSYYSEWVGFTATATINVPSSRKVSFTVASDDGTRVYVDDNLVIDNWRNQYVTPATNEVELSAGKHILRLDYYQKDGPAEVAFSADNEVLSWVESVEKPC